ncbi:hypothetical protein C4J81_01625 [Deltaproteobacteria bacterium Smac51]|nr:hypothetical protein C4J81_01625 [Deltaproteobacteria bacterium Smac51]
MTRKIISLTVFISFAVLVLTSILLYIAPHNQMARQVGWTFLSLHKGQWTSLHITGGFLFIVAGIWHTVINWRVLVNYIRNKSRASFKIPVALLAALAINAFIYIGTVAHIPPLEHILNGRGVLGIFYQEQESVSGFRAGD